MNWAPVVRPGRQSLENHRRWLPAATSRNTKYKLLKCFHYGAWNAIASGEAITMSTYINRALPALIVLVLAAAPAAFAQQPGPNPEPVAQPDAEPAPEPPPAATPAPPPYGVVPAEITLPAGTAIPVRIDEMLSSDRNHQGDGFAATLEQPLVADGVVVAHRGQMVYGRVVEATKATANQPSRLAVELTTLALADGSQVQARSSLTNWQGGRESGREQADTVIGPTVAGAAIGGIAARGAGAVAGAGIGAVAGAALVLLTRNRPTVVYPETAFTFRLDQPLRVSTARAPQAFRFVDPSEYERPDAVRPRPAAAPLCNACGPRPYPGPVYYPGWGYPGWYGTGVGVVLSTRRYGRWR